MNPVRIDSVLPLFRASVIMPELLHGVLTRTLSLEMHRRL